MSPSRASRVAVLAGAAPGFGDAVARRFAAAGYTVAGLARGDGFGRALAAELPAYRHHVCDVTDPDAVARACDGIAREFGPPGVLIYNPMILRIGPFADTDPAAFEDVWRTTCAGAMVLARHLLPGMAEAGGGTAIFTGATASVRGGANFAAFASAKFALRGLAQALAREYAPRGVHVVHTVIDGLVWGPQSQARFAAKRDACLDPAAIADTYLHLTAQPRSAWTHELDLRPFHETF